MNMNINFFKVMANNVASQDNCRGPLQFIYRIKNTKNDETIVASDGHIICFAVVTKEEINKAIYDDIITSMRYNRKTYYISRKKRHTELNDDYPHVLSVIPKLSVVYKRPEMFTIDAPNKSFNGQSLEKCRKLLYYYKGYRTLNASSCQFRFSHQSAADTGICARIEKGIFIGLMPLRCEGADELEIKVDITNKNLLGAINKP